MNNTDKTLRSIELASSAKAIYDTGLNRVHNTPEPVGQKFHIGERVWVGEMPSYMSHFNKNVWGTVKYTYAHAYGGDDIKSYCIDVDNYGEISWYEESQLTRERIN